MRHSPTDLDEPDVKTPSREDFEFDYRRDTTPGKPSWPERHKNQRFGPSFIRKSWQSGLIVIAEIEGYPHPVAAQEVRWGASGVLEVKTLEGPRIPTRLYTRATVKGLDVTGLLIE